MADIIRDSALGQILRYITDKKILLYPEEQPDFEIPFSLRPVSKKNGSSENPSYPETQDQTPIDSSTAPTLCDKEIQDDDLQPEPRSAGVNADELEKNLSTASRRRDIEPTVTEDGTVLVSWYSEHDPANPRNWSGRKKLLISFEISFFTFSVYIGSSMYSLASDGVMEQFGVGPVAAAQGLGLYVLAYGIGPMLFSPLSEIPALGRTSIYIITYGIFLILCIPMSLVQNFAGLLVLRFLVGFFCSPVLATGPATYSDMYDENKMPYVLAAWAAGATFGPALGPVITGFSITAEGWHWFSWELLWLTAPMFLTLFILLPETSASNILLRRAHRLRKLTGNPNLKSQSEIDQHNMSARAIVYEVLVEPWKINALDFAVLYTTIYVSLVYAIFYSFFESFPLVYVDIYHFNNGEMGLAFLSVIVGLAIMAPLYCGYYYFVGEKKIRASPDGKVRPEEKLVPGLLWGWTVPVGIFLFAWTSRPSVHWMASIVGVGIDTAGTFLIMQCMFSYMAATYPNHAASLFAANDFARSSLSYASILFSRPMFLSLGIAGGVSLLGGLTIVCNIALYVLYWWGPELRVRSRFAAKV